MKDLFMGTGIGHSIMLIAFVVASGLFLGKFKFKGISIGATWILFIGILLSHFGLRVDAKLLAFVKDFGLILFVFAIGLQVGPGFFHSFKKGGLTMNLLAVCITLLGACVAYSIHIITGESLQTMTGVMSGAVTNTPGLGAAQQTLTDVMTAAGNTSEQAGSASSNLASAYAVAYPLGVLGVLFLLMIFKVIFKVDLEKEKAELDNEGSSGESARRMHCIVKNPGVCGKSLREIVSDKSDKFVVSRIMRNNAISTPCAETVLEEGDKLLIVTSQPNVESIKILFGEEIPMHVQDWQKMDERLVSKKLVISKSSLTGKRLKELNIRHLYDVNVTRVFRAGVELVASPDLILQMGDTILVVGVESGINDVAKLVGNKPESLSHPNLVPIFFGIALGIVFGSIPIKFPGIPQAVKLGLAGGPLIIAILLGYFGPKWKITTYTTTSANLMIREIGISLFLAAVGLGAGANFISSIVNGGYWWILYGALITLIPLTVVGLFARYVFKLNFYQICGLIAGSTTNPPVLAFAQGVYGTYYTSINYATVYPLSMFMRVLLAQLLILIAFA